MSKRGMLFLNLNDNVDQYTSSKEVLNETWVMGHCRC